MGRLHALAHGVSIKEENIPLLIEYANTTLKDIDFGSDVVEVCGIQPPITALNEFASNKKIYGNGIPEPTFIFEGVITNKDIVVMGTRKDTLKITMNGLTFIKFHAKELIEEFENSTNFYKKIIIAGRPQQNEFRGYINLQIIIDNIMETPYELI